MSDQPMTAPLCFIDTETDGVHPDRRVWEVAMIRRETDGTENEMDFFVEIDLSTADPFGLRVGGFYDRHPLGRYLAGKGVAMPEPYDDGAEYLSTTEAARMVARYTHGAHLVGAVPNFDAEVLARLLRDELLTPAWHYHLVDVEALMAGWLAGRVAPPWRSDDLSLAVGVVPPSETERHTAMGDARWAMRCYDRVVGGMHPSVSSAAEDTESEDE